MNNYIFESFNKAENGQFRNELKKTDLIRLSSYRRTCKQKWLKFAESIFNDFTYNGLRFQNLKNSRLIIMKIIATSLTYPNKGIIVNEETYHHLTTRKAFLIIINSLQEYGLIYILEEYTDEDNMRHTQAIYPTIQLPKIFDSLKARENKIIMIKENNIKKMHDDIIKIKEDIIKGKNDFEKMESEVLQILN